MLNTDRQEHRALIELMDYLRLDSSDLERLDDGTTARLERWKHSELKGDIDVRKSTYSVQSGGMEGVRQISFQWGDKRKFVDYDVDGLTSEPVWNVEIVLDLGSVQVDHNKTFYSKDGIQDWIGDLIQEDGVEIIEVFVDGVEMENLKEWL
jgi:hypothetical protein